MNFRTPLSTALIAVSCLVFAHDASAQTTPPNLNRLVACRVTNNATQEGDLIFLDPDTLQVDAYRFPRGFIPSWGVAMDRHGDVWVMEWGTSNIHKFSGIDGTRLAIAQHPGVITGLTTDRHANLIVGSYGPPYSGTNQSAFLHRYDLNGTLTRVLDFKTLFPRGHLVGISGVMNNPFGGGIPFILMEPSGGLWLGLRSARTESLIKLREDWTLAGSFGIYNQYMMMPDNSGGLWVLHGSGQVLGHSPPLRMMSGVPYVGWVHLDANGMILLTHANASPGQLLQSRCRVDGRQHLFYGGNSVWTHNPLTGGLQWFDPQDSVPLPPLPYTNIPVKAELDGNQRLWTLRAGGPSNPQTWHRSALEPPYLGPREVDIDIGQAFGASVGNPQRMMSWGESSLFRYCKSTDPWGDLDGDGVPNLEELLAFSNPLVPYAASRRPSVSLTRNAVGNLINLTWSVPGDQGLPYLAALATAPALTSLGNGWFLPVSLTDPLVQASLTGAAGWGMWGTLDAQGLAAMGAAIPPGAGLSGLAVTTCIATFDPTTPAMLETVSYPFTITLP
jgi:hypothetical protein